MTAATLLLAVLLPAEQAAAAPPNVLLLCVDDLRPELSWFGADWIAAPHIDALAACGRRFTRHYVQAPTCGAARYARRTRRYGPPGHHARLRRAKRRPSD
ncbi:MAG: sulfatase-like hydrolase/transferase, partial [Planctomycetota bacterium]